MTCIDASGADKEALLCSLVSAAERFASDVAHDKLRLQTSVHMEESHFAAFARCVLPGSGLRQVWFHHPQQLPQLLDVLSTAIDEGGAADDLEIVSTIGGRAPSAKELASLSQCARRLRHLDIVWFKAGAAGGAALSEALAAPGCALVTLNAARNGFGDKGVSALARGLSVNTSLLTLRLGCDFIDAAPGAGARGAEALAAALAKNNTLRTLDLYCCGPIGDDGANSLAAALAVNRTLTKLNLGACELTKRGVSAVGDALAANPASALLHLGLGCNKAGDEGAESVARALAKLPLKSLELFQCSIGDKGAAALARALEGDTTLETLRLDENTIGNAGAEALRSVLKRLRKSDALRNLSIAGNEIKNRGLRRYLEAY